MNNGEVYRMWRRSLLTLAGVMLMVGDLGSWEDHADLLASVDASDCDNNSIRVYFELKGVRSHESLLLVAVVVTGVVWWNQSIWLVVVTKGQVQRLWKGDYCH